MSELKYKVGDRMVVVGNASYHRFDIGEEVMVSELMIESNPNYSHYKATNDEGKDWLVVEEDLMPLLSEEE